MTMNEDFTNGWNKAIRVLGGQEAMYEIRGAITSVQYGPKVPYDEAYEDVIPLQSKDVNDLLHEVENLQNQHDWEYAHLNDDPVDFGNAPCYAECVYNTVTEEKVEL